MSIAKTLSAVVIGLEGMVVEVEAVMNVGPPALHVIGLHDQAAESASRRVRDAALNSEIRWPSQNLIVSLYPVSLPKPGNTMELAIAVSVLAAAGSIPTQGLDSTLFLAELGQDGAVRPARGVLPAVRAAAELGVSTVVVAPENAAEAAAIDGVRVLAPRTLTELFYRARLFRWLTEPDKDLPDVPPAPAEGWKLPWQFLGTRRSAPPVELAQAPLPAVARRAVEVAAAGGHDLLLLGRPEPGAGYAPGRTLVAEALAALLPPMDRDEQLAAATMSSLAGLLDAGDPLPSTPVFRTVHHTVSVTGPAGRMTSSGSLAPGAMLLAQHGVLEIGDAPELERRVVDKLHRTLTSGWIRMSRRSTATVVQPRFQLVLGASMCPCENIRAGECSCPPAARRRYLDRIAPLVDDLPVKVLLDAEPVEIGGDSTAAVATHVWDARDRARARLADTPWTTNAQVPASVILSRFLPDDQALELLSRRLAGTSVPILKQVLQLAWTLTDLAGLPLPGPDQVHQALALHHTPAVLTGESTAPEQQSPEPGTTEPER
ncbi:ATP-binding protein [Actinomadura violacea]|uniref:ATP-binding protein n=1 Tax=Actinomadura violacea TaxID=2819934 RepID=A0ABS3S8C0_9ACTN|nr:ATP-binding protein [Actinomadura violacea]MBO2465003.1 ATP-binding protein [Actinomadura violacea]